MDQRYKAMKELSRSRRARVSDIASYNAFVDESKRFKWIVVVLDEFADLTSDKDQKKAIEVPPALLPPAHCSEALSSHCA